ncbi:MAG: 30S ribosome-binding factor RbfA [Nitrosomonadales bacterium]|jgi:ribosome-binding factor A
MAKDYPRSEQIGQQIRKEVAEILQFEISHPDLRNITITDVNLSPDLRHAKIYFAAEKNKQEIDKAFSKSMSFIRQKLSKRMTTRGIPNLEFIYDKVIDQSDRISFLLNQANKK